MFLRTRFQLESFREGQCKVMFFYTLCERVCENVYVTHSAVFRVGNVNNMSIYFDAFFRVSSLMDRAGH